MEPTPIENGIKTWQWVVTVVVIIALIVIGIFVFGSKKTVVTETPDQTPPVTTPVQVVNRVILQDQFPGNVVNLSSVQLAKAGWVVIRKDNAGQPGDIIGSAYFDAGTNPGKVTLTKPTIDGGLYYAVLYNDDGDKKFDAVKDLPLTDASGHIIMSIFHATTAANAEIKG